jgi:hypothetical protein
VTGFQSWLDTIAPYASAVLGIVNLWVLFRAKNDIKQLETNTNSKMDQVLAAKDAVAKAQVGEADALGAQRGRNEEIARQNKEQT